ncbi:50S ribosomal protein L25 [Waddlia chondrophila 2032/99]|uniref:Large ribosomal subunit protein bL25 n=2 Tax=Waddlia chondrophila TaxID=71667 RepID=D6YVM0_WADCW|nr:50S ribosomal protein L25/general stress protein Ctc [Waddlia chondrophila]ADI38181.1 50S ribosomal protein L25 [Waddlia chondrophila WSU 86-1044]CCB90310.1 50S ribosomal protein L25 [Waddlia chondrophila 2032/99]
MKLKFEQRTAEKKSDSRSLRNLGKIPAVLYVRGKDSEAIAVDAADFETVLRTVKKGRLSTTKLALVDGTGKERNVLVKDIQYHVTTYNVLHLDFEELLDNVKIKVKVPIECVGEVDCVGIKLGGVLRRVIRYLRVHCLPKDLPEFFKMDVKTLGLKESRKLSDLEIPETVRPLMDLNEVAVTIAKR